MNRILTLILRLMLCTTLSVFDWVGGGGGWRLSGKNVLVAGEVGLAGLHGGRMGCSFDLP